MESLAVSVASTGKGGATDLSTEKVPTLSLETTLGGVEVRTVGVAKQSDDELWLPLLSLSLVGEVGGATATGTSIVDGGLELPSLSLLLVREGGRSHCIRFLISRWWFVVAFAVLASGWRSGWSYCNRFCIRRWWFGVAYAVLASGKRCGWG